MAYPAKRCVRCIQTASYPGIEFDSDGVCSVCRAFERRVAAEKDKRNEAEFLRILGKARKRNPKCNALVGISGGKDSSYVLHLMVRRYKANVLAFTHDNGFYTDEARQNVDTMVKTLGVDHRYVTMDKGLFRRIHQALLKNRCADLCLGCPTGGIAAANALAMEHHIPIVVWGFSPQTEPIFPLEFTATYDYRYLVNAVKPYVKRSELGSFRHAAMPWLFYTLVMRRVRYVFLPEYVDWNDRAIGEVLSKEYGWVDYGNGKPHFDCLLADVYDYFLNQRFGTSRIVEKLSQMVRCGQLTREEALARSKSQDPVEEPSPAVDELCRRLDITRDDLKPFLRGAVKDYRYFKGYTSLFHRLSWVFWLTYKLGFTSEVPYLKYR